jgi:hypothetical protein
MGGVMRPKYGRHTEKKMLMLMNRTLAALGHKIIYMSDSRLYIYIKV